MTELPADRQNTTPDKWTLAWIEKRFADVLTAYRGASHGINRAMALYDDFISEATELRKRVDSLELEREADRAKIGELQARLERMAAFLNSQRKTGSKEPTL